MADPARPAHPAGAPLVAILSLGLALMPLPVGATPPPTVTAPAAPAEASGPPAAPAEPSEEAAAEGTAAPEAEADPAPAEGSPADAPPDAVEPGDEATDAAGDGEATATDDATAPAPAKGTAGPPPGTLGPTAAPLRPMQTAAWWTMFGAFALGTTAGVLAGLAERQEDRATRLSTLFDAETGAQPLYADRKDEYEQYLRRGETYSRTAIGVGVVAGVSTIAAITLFVIDARRQKADAAPKRDKPRRAALRMRSGGVEVRF